MVCAGYIVEKEIITSKPVFQTICCLTGGTLQDEVTWVWQRICVAPLAISNITKATIADHQERVQLDSITTRRSWAIRMDTVSCVLQGPSHTQCTVYRMNTGRNRTVQLNRWIVIYIYKQR